MIPLPSFPSSLVRQPPTVQVSSPPASPSAVKTFDAPVAASAAAVAAAGRRSASPWFDADVETGAVAHKSQSPALVSPVVGAAEDEANPWH